MPINNPDLKPGGDIDNPMTHTHRPDLVEKVAKAIWAATEDDPWEDGCGAKDFVRTEARAAIAAVLDDLEAHNSSTTHLGVAVGTLRARLSLASTEKPNDRSC